MSLAVGNPKTFERTKSDSSTIPAEGNEGIGLVVHEDSNVDSNPSPERTPSDDDEEDKKNFPIFKPRQFYPYSFETYRKDWAQVKTEILAGIVVSFAQIPESIAFSFLAGVPPIVGLHAAWIMGFFVAAFGSRPGMISGATGAQAAVLLHYVKDLGIEMMFLSVLVAGILQVIYGMCKLSKLARLIPVTVMIGFVNGLAIIIGLAQLSSYLEPPVSNKTYVSGGKLGLMIMISIIVFITVKFFPKLKVCDKSLGDYIPSSILGILIGLLIEYAIIRTSSSFKTTTIGDLGNISGNFPIPIFNDPQYKVPSFSYVFRHIWEPAIVVSLIGVVETLMTLEVVADLTKTQWGELDQVIIASGVAQIFAGIFGTMGGHAVIGLSFVNCHSGSNGRYRISGIVASLMVLFIILAAYPIINAIPIAALVGIMGVVVYQTFEWNSLAILFASALPKSLRENKYFELHRKINRLDAVVIILVTVVTVTVDLLIAVVVGVLFSAAVYAYESADELIVTSQLVDDGQIKIYRLEGPLFFGNARHFPHRFDYENDPQTVHIHLKDSMIHDYSAFEAINEVGAKYKALNKTVFLKHICEKSNRVLRKASHLMAESVTFEAVSEIEVVDQGEITMHEPHHLHIVSEDHPSVA